MSLQCHLPVSGSVGASSLICSAAVLPAERGGRQSRRGEEEKWKWKRNKGGILWNSVASGRKKHKKQEYKGDFDQERKREREKRRREEQKREEESAELALLHCKVWLILMLLYSKVTSLWSSQMLRGYVNAASAPLWPHQSPPETRIGLLHSHTHTFGKQTRKPWSSLAWFLNESLRLAAEWTPWTPNCNSKKGCHSQLNILYYSPKGLRSPSKVMHILIVF